jgi:hypothetical protein
MSSSRIAWRIIIVALIAASWSAYGSLVHSASLGSTQILMRIDASGSVPQTGIAPAWLICNGRLTKTGDVGGVFSGKATPRIVTGATRIQSTVKLLKPTQGHRMIGFALYRSWASPHWLQVESYGAATDCDGPWRGPVDGRGLLYGTRSPGARVPPGRYYLSLLWTRTATYTSPIPFLYAELSNRQFQLPLPAGSTISLWSCTGPVLSGRCSSALFRTF